MGSVVRRKCPQRVSARSPERNMEGVCALAPHLVVAATVVEASCLGVGVPREVLNRAEVHPAIQQAAHEGPAEVVRGAALDPCLLAAAPEPEQEGLGGHAAEGDGPGLGHGIGAPC